MQNRRQPKERCPAALGAQRLHRRMLAILSAVMPQHAFGFLYPGFAISGIQAAPPSPPPSPPLPPRAPHLPPSPPPPLASCEMVRMPIDGFCRAGYYAGAESGRLLRGTTAAEETRSYATEETCLSMCLNEERCRYAALKDGVSCSRYGAEAGNCTNDQQCATVNGACPCGACGYRLYRKPSAPCSPRSPPPGPEEWNICTPGGHVLIVHARAKKRGMRNADWM